MHSRLTIAYGAAYTRAALAQPGAVWTVLPFEGGLELSSAVHVSGTDTADFAVGARAWRRAEADPAGFVLSPLRAGSGEVVVGGNAVEVADLAAATLRHVAEQVATGAGAPVEEVCWVVPAGWGPRRRTWLRHAARAAGLPVSGMVETPVAAAPRLAAANGGAGAPILVIDIGGGCETTVVQRDPSGSGFEVLSTLADADAGGDRVDAALAVTLAGALTGPAAQSERIADVQAGPQWPVLAVARAAKHALSEQVAVSMPMPAGNPPVVITAAHVTPAAQPVLERVAELAAETVTYADLTVSQLGAVHLIGGAARTSGAAAMIAGKLGAAVEVADQPESVAVLGAAGADPGSSVGAAAAGEQVPLPPLRRLILLGLPGLLSLMLYAHFVFGAEFYNGTPRARQYGYYVLVSWGELTVACVLAAVGCVQAAALFAALLDQYTPGSAPSSDSRTGESRIGDGRTSGRGAGESRIVAGLGLAAAAALAVASLYAVTAGVYIAYPVPVLLRWSLLPVLPTAIGVLMLAAVAWRRRPAPARGWDGFLTFPVTSIITVAAGVALVTVWWHGLPDWVVESTELPGSAGTWNTLRESFGYLGGVLIGAAIACTLVRHPAARVVLAVVLGFFTLIISRAGPGIPAVLYAIAVTWWCITRIWLLARTPTVPQPG